jgi:hypothetical protein
MNKKIKTDKIIRIEPTQRTRVMKHTVEKSWTIWGIKPEIVAVKLGIFLTNLFMNSESLEFYKNIGYCHDQWSVDIAVHMKDVPCTACIVLFKQFWKSHNLDMVQGECWFLNELELLLPEVWRQAQWLNKYQHIKAVDLRGNVNTRMQNYKMDWNGLFTGLERINLNLKIISI